MFVRVKLRLKIFCEMLPKHRFNVYQRKACFALLWFTNNLQTIKFYMQINNKIHRITKRLGDSYTFDLLDDIMSHINLSL